MSGTLIGQLRQPNSLIEASNDNKRKHSPPMNQEVKLQKITPDLTTFNQWGILVDRDDQ